MTHPLSHSGRLLAALFAFVILPHLSAISVWINEIHYDNIGGDTGEFVEIAGVAGTSLAGYTLILYNGSNQKPYYTISLSGFLSDQSNGFGTFRFNKTGIQNGAPDGIALIGPGNVFIQFLSYEGSFQAVGDAADGKTSSDIGFSESSSTPVGYSLQLIGTGSRYSDFSWTSPSAASPGEINARQTFLADAVFDTGSSVMLLGIGLSGMLMLRRWRINRDVR